MKLHCYWSVVSAFFGALIHCDAWIAPLPSIASFPRSSSIETKDNTRFRNRSDRDMIGTGFSFEDGQQILVSIQKPFGIILEQGSEEDDDGRIFVTEVDPNGSAGKAGVRTGDVLVAVQNASTTSANLDEVLDFIATKCPRVVNLRFQRED